MFHRGHFGLGWHHPLKRATLGDGFRDEDSGICDAARITCQARYNLTIWQRSLAMPDCYVLFRFA